MHQHELKETVPASTLSGDSRQEKLRLSGQLEDHRHPRRGSQLFRQTHGMF